jgi:hypothetical protein
VYWSAFVKELAILQAAYSAPITKRMEGPNRVAAASPVKYNPDTKDSQSRESVSADQILAKEGTVPRPVQL